MTEFTFAQRSRGVQVFICNLQNSSCKSFPATFTTDSEQIVILSNQTFYTKTLTTITEFGKGLRFKDVWPVTSTPVVCQKLQSTLPLNCIMGYMWCWKNYPVTPSTSWMNWRDGAVWNNMNIVWGRNKNTHRVQTSVMVQKSVLSSSSPVSEQSSEDHGRNTASKQQPPGRRDSPRNRTLNLRHESQPSPHHHHL